MKARLKKHEGLITVLSVIIVVASFWVKDNVREQYKEWASDIDHAQTDFDLATQNADILKELDTQREIVHGINSNVWDLRYPEHKEAYRPDKHFDLARFGVGERKDLNDASVAMNVLRRFMEKLPEHKHEEEEYKHIQKDITLVRKWSDDSQQLIYAEDLGHAKEIEELRRVVTDDYNLVEQEKYKDKTFGHQMIEDLKESIVAKAEVQKQKYGVLSGVLKWVNIVLFLAGSVIGLAAKWAGIKEESAVG